MDSKGKLLKNSVYLMIIVFWGKILGFLKQSVIAWKFGTTANLDVYFSADSFVSMISQIIIISIPPAIVTTIIKIKKGEEEKEKFISSVFIFFLALGIILIFLNTIISPIMSDILGISYDFEQKKTLVKYLLYLSPIILFACVSGVSSGLLQSKRKFIQDKVMGILLSLSIIIFIVVFEDKLKIISLLLGFVFGYLIFSILMLVLLIKNTKIKIINPMKNFYFKKFIRVLIPIIIGVSIVDISHLIDKMIASSLASGSVSVLYYSQIICSDLVNGVIIGSIGIVLLPKVTKEIENKKNNQIRDDINSIISVTVPIMLVITVLYLFVGKDLISIAFNRGAFSKNAVKLVYYCSICYSIGLPFIMIKEIISKYLYAMDNTFSPMLSNVISIIINIILSIILSKYIGVAGIALSTSISDLISNVVLLRSIKKQIVCKRVINDNCLLDVFKTIIILVPICIINSLIKMFIKNSFVLLITIDIITLLLFIILSKLLNLSIYNKIIEIISKRRKKLS